MKRIVYYRSVEIPEDSTSNILVTQWPENLYLCGSADSGYESTGAGQHRGLGDPAEIAEGEKGSPENLGREPVFACTGDPVSGWTGTEILPKDTGRV